MEYGGGLILGVVCCRFKGWGERILFMVNKVGLLLWEVVVNRFIW